MRRYNLINRAVSFQLRAECLLPLHLCVSLSVHGSSRDSGESRAFCTHAKRICRSSSNGVGSFDASSVRERLATIATRSMRSPAGRELFRRQAQRAVCTVPLSLDPMDLFSCVNGSGSPGNSFLGAPTTATHTNVGKAFCESPIGAVNKFQIQCSIMDADDKERGKGGNDDDEASLA